MLRMEEERSFQAVLKLKKLYYHEIFSLCEKLLTPLSKVMETFCG